jgi:tetratricopeptide (TPR) repeat protein
MPGTEPCKAPLFWDGQSCRKKADLAPLLAARTALANFAPEKARPSLERAREQSPYPHEELILLYEQLGILFAYLEDEERALEAFRYLLTIAPQHAVAYGLGPSVTEVYVKAQAESQERAPMAVDVRWREGMKVGQTVPLMVDVLANPSSLLDRISLFVRASPDEEYRSFTLRAPRPGKPVQLVLPAVDADEARALQIFASGYDAHGNELLRWASRKWPRQIPLTYTVTVPWYRKWWVWASVGGALALGTGAVVYATSQQPPSIIGGSVGF